MGSPNGKRRPTQEAAPHQPPSTPESLIIRSDFGHDLRWAQQEGRWQRVSDPPEPPLPPLRTTFRFDAEGTRRLVSDAEFAVSWEIARRVAPLPPRLARQDLIASWELVTARCDVRVVLDLVAAIRASAIERYIDAEDIDRAVRRLLHSVDRTTA